jgi:transposase
VERYVTYVIPRRREREGHHAGQVDRPTAFDRETYARRYVVERCENRLKQWRGIASRYEKRATNYRAMVVIASLIM